MLIFVAVIPVFIFALFANALFRPPTRPAAFLGLYLLSYANIIFVSEIAGTLFLLNSRVFLLIVHLILAILAWLFWRRAGKPSLLGPMRNHGTCMNKVRLLSSLKRWPDLWVLGGSSDPDSVDHPFPGNGSIGGLGAVACGASLHAKHLWIGQNIGLDPCPGYVCRL